MMRALTSLCQCIISDQRCGLLQAFRFVKNEDATRGRRGGGGTGGEAEGGLRRKWAGAIYPFCDVIKGSITFFPLSLSLSLNLY